MYFGTLDWNRLLDKEVLINIFFGKPNKEELNLTIESIVSVYNDKLLLFGRKTNESSSLEDLKTEANELVQLVKNWKRGFIKPGTKALVNTADLRQIYSTASQSNLPDRPVIDTTIQVEEPVIREINQFVPFQSSEAPLF